MAPPLSAGLIMIVSLHRNVLTANFSQPGKFYLLPKIDKPNNPGRTIVCNKLTLTEKISQYVEFHLKPYAQNANSFIQDTTDFLNKL